MNFSRTFGFFSRDKVVEKCRNVQHVFKFDRYFDILPENVNFDIIDGFTKVTDKDAALYTQRLAKDEGMFLGNSAGAAIKGVLQLKNEFKKEDVVVVLFHDHGSRYVGKIFNDDWMRKMGYIDK